MMSRKVSRQSHVDSRSLNLARIGQVSLHITRPGEHLSHL
jgi:hypothetical protein